MTKVTKSIKDQEREKQWEEIKNRDEMKQRYGVFTQKMLEDLFDRKLDEKLDPLKKKMQIVDEKLDWLMGKYFAHDEEHTLLNNKVSEHSDNLELLNAKVGIQI